jgi:CRP-like cAMP-binding protein
MTTTDLFASLQRSPLLSGMTEDGIRIVQSICVARQVPPGTPVFVERMLGESAFLLLSGEVSVTVARPGGPRELGTLVAPDVFGELSLLRPGARRVTVTAKTTVDLAEIARRDFLQLQKQRPQACVKLMITISERFGRAAQDAGPLFDALVDVVG